MRIQKNRVLPATSILVLVAIMAASASGAMVPLPNRHSANAFVQEAARKEWSDSRQCWSVENIPEGYLLTYSQPVVFIRSFYSSSKPVQNDQLRRERKGLLQLKIVFGPPLARGPTDTIQAEGEEYSNPANGDVLPEILAQGKEGFFLCHDALWRSDEKKTVYFFVNAGPDEDIDHVYNANCRCDNYYDGLLAELCHLFHFDPDPFDCIED
jgi:hypothetical protein